MPASRRAEASQVRVPPVWPWPALALPCEDFFENVCCGSTESTGQSTQKIEVNRALRICIGCPCIEKVLRPPRETFHCNEVFKADEVEFFSMERHFQRAGEQFWIHPAESTQQLDLIPVDIAQDKHRRNGIIRISATEFGLEAGPLKYCLQTFQLTR